jgi:radical SAM protein with 4Fe4S-binding SPASM domain
MSSVQDIEQACSAEQERREYDRAAEMLRQGRLKEGSHVLGSLAERTCDDELRSDCLSGLAKVLEALGQDTQAYQLLYSLGHKPPNQRNMTDVHARLKVMRLFERRGLELRPPDFPPKVQLEVTNRCNLRCIMCTRNQMERPQGDMSPEVVRKVADECCREPGTVVSLYFLGEPLLNRDLEQMAACLASVKDYSQPPLVFGIQTNAMLLNRERTRTLLEAGLRHFAVSLDGLEGDLERVRPGASYPVVEQNVLDLLSLGEEMGLDDLEVHISKLCDDPAAEEVRRFREIWQPRVKQVHLIGISKVEGNAYMAADGQIEQVKPRAPSPNRSYCGQGQRLLIHWNGDFAFCCSDINGEIKLGNIRDHSIREIWNSPEMHRLRKQIKDGNYEGLAACQRCPHSRA